MVSSTRALVGQSATVRFNANALLLALQTPPNKWALMRYSVSEPASSYHKNLNAFPSHSGILTWRNHNRTPISLFVRSGPW